MHKYDYTGKRFGKLLVIEEAGTQKWCSLHAKNKNVQTRVIWRVICDCGKEFFTSTNNLSSGRSNSCGCNRKTWYIKHDKAFNTSSEGNASKNCLLSSYKTSARSRNKNWELTDEQFFELCQQNCHYCGAPPSTVWKRRLSSYTYNGVDRKDNLQGYTIENSLPCCQNCNRAKMARSYDEFITWLIHAGDYWKKKLKQESEMANQNSVRSSLKGHVEVGGKKSMPRRTNSISGANNFGRKDTGKMNS